MAVQTNPECSRRLPVLPELSSTAPSCTICSLTPPPSCTITSSHGEAFCLPCLRYTLIEKHQDGNQEPAIQDSQSRRERDFDSDVDDNADDEVQVLVENALREMRREKIEQLQQLEENLEHLKVTVVCALGLRSVEDRAWADEAIAKERLATRREIAWLEVRQALKFHAALRRGD